jgi:hypothetical protein
MLCLLSGCSDVTGYKQAGKEFITKALAANTTVINSKEVFDHIYDVIVRNYCNQEIVPSSSGMYVSCGKNLCAFVEIRETMYLYMHECMYA